MKDRRDEQGGVVSFVVIAVALSVLLIGGIFLMKYQARVARDAADNVAVSEEKNNDQSNSSGTSDSGEASDNTTPQDSDTTTDSSGSSNSTGTTGTTGTTTPTPPPSGSTSTTGTTGTVATTGPSSTDDDSGSLPSTGLSDGLLPLLALGGVSGGLYAFVRSQRTMRGSALK